jgi:N6-L-threonylcarbamoyladenine synthase
VLTDIGKGLSWPLRRASQRGFPYTQLHISIKKVLTAAKAENLSPIDLVIGVSANQRLRTSWQESAHAAHLPPLIAPLKYTTDNAAMVAVAGWHRYLSGLYAPILSVPFSKG